MTSHSGPVRSTSNSGPKVALITGASGQDGTILTEYLLELGYIVHGVVHDSIKPHHVEALPRHPNFYMCAGNIEDYGSILNIVRKLEPNEIYNLAAQSSVGLSFKEPLRTALSTGMGAVNILEAVRVCNLVSKTRVIQACSSEMFGTNASKIPLNEDAPFNPVSPYAVNKVYAYWMVKNYRTNYNLFACSAIMFNHESVRRTEAFVTRKISAAAARIRCGLQECLYLGNLNVSRDWGHARDFVIALYKMMQMDTPKDYVLATGVATSLRDFASRAFECADMPLDFEGEGLTEIAFVTSGPLSGRVVLRISPEYYRPSELEAVVGDSTRAQADLKWDPNAHGIDYVIRELVSNDLAIARKACEAMGRAPEPSPSTRCGSTSPEAK